MGFVNCPNCSPVGESPHPWVQPDEIQGEWTAEKWQSGVEHCLVYLQPPLNRIGGQIGDHDLIEFSVFVQWAPKIRKTKVHLLLKLEGVAMGLLCMSSDKHGSEARGYRCI